MKSLLDAVHYSFPVQMTTSMEAAGSTQTSLLRLQNFILIPEV